MMVDDAQPLLMGLTTLCWQPHAVSLMASQPYAGSLMPSASVLTASAPEASMPTAPHANCLMLTSELDGSSCTQVRDGTDSDLWHDEHSVVVRPCHAARGGIESGSGSCVAPLHTASCTITFPHHMCAGAYVCLLSQWQGQPTLSSSIV